MRAISRNLASYLTYPKQRPAFQAQRMMRTYYGLTHTQMSPFLAPNERNPLKAKEIYGQVQKGVYIGVGTDRCLFPAVMSENIEAIYMADYDHSICTFNKDNISMIKACKNRQSYLELRNAESYTSFREALSKLGYHIDPDLLDLNQEKHYNWFQNALQSSGFQFYKEANPSFSKLSYLFSDSAYERIHSLAAQNKIHVLQFDASSPTDVYELGQILKERNETASVYDLSNAFWPSFISPLRCPQKTYLLGPESMPDSSTIVLTDCHDLYGDPWFYMGFNKGQLVEAHRKNPQFLSQKFSVGGNLFNRTSLVESFGTKFVDRMVDIEDEAPMPRNSFLFV